MSVLQKRPEVGKPQPWSFAHAEEHRLPNGLNVLLYRRAGQYVVSSGLALDLPLTAEPRDKEGVASVTANTLSQGTRLHPKTAFADAVEDCGAVLQAATGHSSTQVFLDVPGSHLGAALGLLAECVSEPLLAADDVDRERALKQAQTEQQLANSPARADHAARRTFLRRRYRAARMAGGEPDTLASVGVADVQDFHGRFYGPRGATLVLAGDFDDSALDQVTDAFGDWTNPDQAFGVHESPQPRHRHAYLIDRPGSVQADVRLGRFSIDRSDPRWPALTIASYALGGAFLSRLNKVLREEKGFTYGVHLANAPMRAGGYSCVQGSFRNDALAQAVSLMPSLLDVGAQPITAEEVERARTYLSGVQPLQYATASGVCNGIMGLLSAGLSADYIDSLRSALERVTPEMATETASELMPPDELSLVIVGDASVLAADLARQGISTRVVANGDWI